MPHHAVAQASDPFQALSRRFSGDPTHFLPVVERAIAALESDQSLEQLARARVGDELAHHFAHDWLSNSWPDQQPIEPELRRGLLVAFHNAVQRRLPLEFATHASGTRFWVDPDADKTNKTKISVVIWTPATGETSGAPAASS